jgi:2-iminobutanoate/2-iminopropanoate deaminase
MRAIALASLLTVVAPACTSTGIRQRQCFHANEAIELNIGYCEAVRVGDTLHISGTAGEGDMPTAMHSVYGRLRKTLEANGLAFSDVVKENVYATDLDAFIQNRELRKTYYGKTFPAATWVQVQRLYVPSLVVEIELTAVYGNSDRGRR